MTSERKAAEAIRDPRQERSQKRVEQILEAARLLIAEKGSARLTISDIAEVANVTPSSMYQYFPGKSAVIYALAEQTIETVRQVIDAVLAASLESRTPSNETFGMLLAELLESYYRSCHEDPTILDIWTGVGADKSLMDLNLTEVENLSNRLLEIAIPLLPERDPALLKKDIRLLIAFGEAATAAALHMNDREAGATIDRAKQMLHHMWLHAGS